MRLLLPVIVVVALVCAPCQVLGVGLPAGTTLSIVCQATCLDPVHGTQVTPPEVLTLTVAQVASVTIDHAPGPFAVNPGEDAYIPINICNHGNGIDAFALQIASSRNWNACLIYDDNADGIHQDSEQWVIDSAGFMVADGYTACFAKVTVPPDAAQGDTLTINAESWFDPTISASTILELNVPEAPTVNITAPTADATYQTSSPTLSIGGSATCGLPIAKIAWSSDRGASGECSGTSDWAASDIPLETGENVITVTAIDSSGRTDTDTLTVTFTDTGAPTVMITEPTNNPTFYTETSTLSISGTASDNGTGVASVAWSNNRGGTGSCSGTTAWSASGISLAQGENIITVTATDEAGNSGTDTLRVTCAVDTASPTVLITSPTSQAAYTTNDATISLAGTASDDIGVTAVTWSSDRGWSGSCTGGALWNVSGISLAVGQNVITITARDASGKTGSAVLTVTYTAANAPSVTITAPTADAAYSTTATRLDLAGTASHDAGISGVKWSNNRGGSGDCSGTTSWSAPGIPLAPGSNVIVITATATTGNTGTSTIVVTRTSPEVMITAPTSGATYTTDASPLTIAGTAWDDVAVTLVEWSNDRGGSGTCAGTTSWTGSVPLVAGQNVITVTVRDASGNTATDTLTVTRTVVEPPIPQVDTTAPTVSITSPTTQPALARNCPTITLGGPASDNVAVASLTWRNSATGGSGVCTLTGGSWISGGIDLAEGANPITVTAQDAAGNIGTASIAVTYINAVPGDAWNGLAMVSLPIVPDSTDPKTETGFAASMWCAFLTASGAYAVYPDRASWLDPAEKTPGRGFWAGFDKAAVPYGTIPAQDQPAVIRLAAGWNQIGTPFISEVTWDLSRITVREPGGKARPLAEMADVVATYLWGWRQDPANPRTGAYHLVYDAALAPGVDNKLEPWRGYWIRAYRECELIIPPP